jgi:adenine deaminase
MTELSNLQDQIGAALGEQPLDLLIRDVRLVDVYRERIVETDLGIRGDRIVSVLPGGRREAAQTIDAGGRYALPGFIDAHIHIESALLTPERLAEVVLPTGTTTLLVDPMEVANVAGYDGLEEFFRSAETLPYRLYVEVSSRVPTAPGLETTGGELGPAEVRRALRWPRAVSLGELDPSKVLTHRAPYLRKILAAHALGKIANGHAAGLAGRDHECVTVEDMKERLAVGLAVIIREGSSERNLRDLIGGVVAENLPTRHLMFCVDDKFSGDIAAEGHINYNVNEAIRLGLNPLRAVQMATLNAAEHFRLDDRLGALVPGRLADIILSDSLDRIVPAQVYVGGRLVAESGRLLQAVPPIKYAAWLRNTVKITRGTRAAHYRVPAPVKSGRVRARVIEIVPDQIINYFREAELEVVNGSVQPDPARDVLKIAVVERHGQNGNVMAAFATGFGLRRGAIGSSVAHDHHNIIVVGTNDADLAACVKAIAKMRGGFAAVADGHVLTQLPLPVAGLMSDRPSAEVNAALEALNTAARELGSPLNSPFMTLSFVSLPSIPEAGLTDMGLVDVRARKFVPVVIGEGE